MFWTWPGGGEKEPCWLSLGRPLVWWVRISSMRLSECLFLLTFKKGDKQCWLRILWYFQTVFQKFCSFWFHLKGREVTDFWFTPQMPTRARHAECSLTLPYDRVLQASPGVSLRVHTSQKAGIGSRVETGRWAPCQYGMWVSQTTS